MSSMNQQFHVVMHGSDPVIRKPLQPGDKYDSKLAIHPIHEVRQFLEPLGTFAMATIDDNDKAMQVLDYGFYNDADKSHWHVAGGYVRDDSTVFVLLPQQISDNEFFSRLGLKVQLSKQSDSFKAGKYLKRLWSHHNKYIQGDVIEEHGDVIIVRLDNGKTISVRYAPKSPLTEGMNLVSQKALKLLGYKNAKHGDGLRVTALSPRGFTKGHAIVLEHLHFDLVMYETKDLLKSNGRFTFALDSLHPGKLFTDSQSVINFQLQPFMTEWAELFMKQVNEAFGDESKLRNMLRFYNLAFHKLEHDTDEQTRGEYIHKDKDWSLTRAMRAGLEVSKIPALLRRSFNLFVQQVMDCERNLRIPIMPETGDARYILVDPTIFDMWGNPSLEGVLKGNEVFAPRHVGPVVFHRQPNAHRGEMHISNSVHPADLEAMDSGCFMFMSKDAIVPTLKKLGGGDQDDRVVYYTDQKIVDHFAQLPAYPVVTIEKPHEVEAAPNRFAYKLRKPMYDRITIKAILVQQKKQKVSIGQAVNPIMGDTHISDQQANIINHLVGIKDKTPKVIEALEWMRNYPGYVMAPVASQLEDVIDGVKKDGADIRHIAKAIKEFWTDLKVVPEFMLHGGYQDGGRLPEWRRGEYMPVIVRTDIDDAKDAIQDIRVELQDAVHLLSWDTVLQMQIPEEILTFPDTPGDEQLAKAIRSFYIDQLQEIMAKAPDEGKARVRAFMKVDENVFNKFSSHPIIRQAMLKLYTMVYSNRALEIPRDENGRPKAFPDGILWGPMMSKLTIEALDMAGLTGRYVEVEFYDDRKKYRRGDHDVLVGDGIVNVGKDEVGMVDPIADGTVKMEGGLIKVPANRVIDVHVPKRYEVLTVVAGWRTRPDATQENIRNWKAQVGKQVQLVPYTRVIETGEEHAVRVMLDGVEYGHITKQRGECYSITVETSGYLAPSNEPHTNTMRVVIDARS